MAWVFLDTKQTTFLSPSNQPYFLSNQHPPPPPSNGFNLSDKVSPSILLIIIILAIIFFISGLLHLLVRFLIRPTNRDPDEFDNVTALQGQLQQLFNLHDSGVDQSFIDTLPVFNYKAIIGLKKSPFDCAVCLCEFESEDKLRLLPKCSHAFHMDCIDTWLLSHSTCPLCRASIAPDFSPNSTFSPIVLVLESGSESSREIFPEREGSLGNNNSIPRSGSQVGFPCEGEFGSARVDFPRKSWEKQGKAEENQEKEKVVPVKLGKFKNVDNGGEGSSNITSDNNLDERRCFSMGSLEYVMDEDSSLKVPIRTPINKKQTSKKSKLPLTPGHRMAMSECGWDSTREFSGFEALSRGGGDTGGGDGDSFRAGNAGGLLGRSKRESFSISKIWLQGKKEKQNFQVEESSRRAVSFRFPVHRNVVSGEEIKGKDGGGGCGTRTIGEIIEIRRGGNERGSEYGVEEEIHSFNSLDSQANSLSFARRTLSWLLGRQAKVVHSSFPTNV